LDAFVALTSVAGGLALVFGSIEPPAHYIEGSAFGSYLVPGLVLALVVGGTSGMATLLVLERSDRAAYASMVAGAMLVGWIAIETAIIGPASWLQAVMAVVGAAQIGRGLTSNRLDVRNVVRAERSFRVIFGVGAIAAAAVIGAESAAGIVLASAGGYLVATGCIGSSPARFLLARRR
jgi:hypothetical protein